MTYIKRLVMHGFKSFASKTELVFDKGINIVIGPNGSGKSNISDALCFVLGRLSTKSIRAAKAKNLLFMGSKYAKPAREALVELVFENTDRAFPMDRDEIILSRIVRHNGLSIYKINNETKTRADVVELLAQAGIDPHGFNLVLQGQIQAVVKMHPEDRRKIVEEVAGISVYESRKQKSLNELEKTEEKLKEISAILRERTAFLRNLENEREQALKFKELELTIKRCKASLLNRRLDDKEKDRQAIIKSIEDRTKQKEKIKHSYEEMQGKIESMNSRINAINKSIQHATGIEQETLHSQIANLKAEIEGLRVRKESFEHRRAEFLKKIEALENSIPQIQEEIVALRTKTPLVAQKQAELAKKKIELAQLEDERKRSYSLKTELSSIKDRARDKEYQLSRIVGESDAILKQIEEYSAGLTHRDSQSCINALSQLRESTQRNNKFLEDHHENERSFMHQISLAEHEISSAEKIKSQVSELDVCPLCQSSITSDHISHVHKEADSRINSARTRAEEYGQKAKELAESRARLTKELAEISSELAKNERELSLHHLIKDKKDYLKRLVEHESELKAHMAELEQKRDSLQNKTVDFSAIEEQYKNKLMEIEEISSRRIEDLDQTLLHKERELERMRETTKLQKKDLDEIESDILELHEKYESRNALLEKKEIEESALSERFKKLFAERDDIQENVQKLHVDSSGVQNQARQVEDQINQLSVANARISAEKEAIEMELAEFTGIELIKAPVSAIEERLQRSQSSLQNIGSINLRALEIYEEIKKEYDRVQEKVTTLTQEKQDILSIIEEIDLKKKKTFMKTFNQMNDLFGSNFARLSTKGQAFLQIENPEDIFNGGVRIVIRLAKGKYFDVTSLSGGEQTLVALSLLFAIQEYKPYHFYIFDEIDAALDKRNSERLSVLLKQYMKSGQYITITHNDALIMNANILYGVSMHEGVSKILSLNIGESLPQEFIQPNPEIQPQTDTSVESKHVSNQDTLATRADTEIAQEIQPITQADNQADDLVSEEF